MRCWTGTGTWAVALAAMCVVGAGCDRNGAKNSQTTTLTQGESAADNPSSLESDMDKDQKRIRKAVAKLMDIDTDAVEVEIIGEPEVPGITVYKARASVAGEVVYNVGVVQGREVITDNEQALQKVVQAWKYGRERTVPPDQVAAVFGVLEGADQAWMPIVTQSQLDPMSEERKKIMFLPRETEVDGKPAVQYWVTSAEPPLWLTTAVIEDDGSVSIRVEEKWVF